MEQWEYLHVTFQQNASEWIARWTVGYDHKSTQGSLNVVLNAIGDEGWELVAFDVPLAHNAVFKRRKP